MSKASILAWVLFISSFPLHSTFGNGDTESIFRTIGTVSLGWLIVLGIMRVFKLKFHLKKPEQPVTAPATVELVTSPAKGKDYVVLSRNGGTLPLAQWATETNPDIDLLTWYEIMHVVTTHYSEDTVEELKDLGRGELMVDDMIAAFGKDRTAHALDMWGNSPLSWDACAKSLTRQEFKDVEKRMLQIAAANEKQVNDKPDASSQTHNIRVGTASKTSDMIFTGVMGYLFAKIMDDKGPSRRR